MVSLDFWNPHFLCSLLFLNMLFIWRPPDAIQETARFSMFSITVFKMSWPMKLISVRMASFKMLKDFESLWCTFPFRYPQKYKKKTIGDRYGYLELEGLPMSPNREINLLGKLSLNTSMLDLVVRQVAQSCWKKCSTKQRVSTKRILY